MLDSYILQLRNNLSGRNFAAGYDHETWIIIAVENIILSLVRQAKFVFLGLEVTIGYSTF